MSPRVGVPVVTAVTDDALGTDDTVGLARRLTRREVCPDELWEAAVARAHAVDATLGAVASWIDRPQRAVSPDDAPLRGIPTVLKDTEDLAGVPTLWGSAAVPRVPLTRTSEWTAQFLAMGAQPIAKATLPEFGLTASTESTRHGPTRNPWDTRRSAGGSSGGTAALVAAGVVPIGHANDGAGSIRIPAACCGLVGMKPSRGRVIDRPDRARMPVPITTQGVLTRSVRDTAWYLAEAERCYRNPSLPPVGHVRGPAARRLRIGLRTTTLPGLPVSPSVVATAREVADLCAALGHDVAEVDDVGDPGVGPDFLHYWALLGFALHHGGRVVFGPGYDPARLEPLTQALSARALRHLAEMPGALRRLRARARVPEAGLDRVDVVVSPVVAHEPPPIGHLGPQVDPFTHMVRLLRWISFTPVQNISGSPALALPVGFAPSGLPRGVQLVARRGQERLLLGLAFELDEALR